MDHRNKLNIFWAALLSIVVIARAEGQKRHQFSVVIYAIKDDGSLWWYNHRGALDGADNWDEPKQVGTDWQNVQQIFSAKGKLYAIKDDGTLWWYNHRGALDGTPIWDDQKEVAKDWQHLHQVFSCNGKIYGIREDGTLWWYNHKGAEVGSSSWDNTKQVGTGWQNLQQIFSCNGNIYVIKADGTLWWYNHKGAVDGSFSWDNPKQVGTGWQNLKQAFGAFGRIYAIKENGTLWWFNPKGAADGSFNWDDAKQIASGWGNFILVTPRLIDDISPPDIVPPPVTNNPSPPIVLPIVIAPVYPKDVSGAIGDKYLSMRGGRVIPGLPLGKEQSTADKKGRYQIFKGCVIYWHPPIIGAHEMHGSIQELYNKIDGENLLGYPTTDQTTCPDNIGHYNHFRKFMSNGTWADASIYWSPGHGAVEIYGPIREKWAELGWEKSKLGYPVSSEFKEKGYRTQQFEKGEIRWSDYYKKYEITSGGNF
jgi:hypothetical protein